MRFVRLFALVAVLISLPARAAVVINEIFYHAPDDLDDIQWIELHNTADAAVDLSGWHFDAGVGFTFAKDTKIEAGGFVVVARNPEHFRQIYRSEAMGPFERSLGRSGGKIELLNAAGK